MIGFGSVLNITFTWRTDLLRNTTHNLQIHYLHSMPCVYASNWENRTVLNVRAVIGSRRRQVCDTFQPRLNCFCCGGKMGFCDSQFMDSKPRITLVIGICPRGSSMYAHNLIWYVFKWAEFHLAGISSPPPLCFNISKIIYFIICFNRYTVH